MKLYRLFCGALAALMMAMAGGLAMAAESYQETALPMAKSHTDEYPRVWVCPAGAENLDYFYMKSRTLKGKAPEWYHSGDGGKTWQEKDTGWYAAIKEKAKQNIIDENLKWAKENVAFDLSFENAGTVKSLYMAQSGTAYFVIQTATRLQKYESSKTETPGRSYSEYGEYEVYKVKDGKAQPIPGILLGEPITEQQPFQHYEILRAEEGGELVLLADKKGRGGATTKARILRYDEKTGKRLSESPEFSAWNQKFVAAGNQAYTIGFESKDGDLMAFDLNTGAKTLSIPLHIGELNSENLGASPNGTVYVTHSGGVFRLEPGAKALTKLLDGAGTHLSQWPTGGPIGGMLGCTDGGRIYSVTENAKGMTDKLYCYEPKQ